MPTMLPPIAIVSASITRPADTTAYTSGDVIGTASSHVITLPNAGRIVGAGISLTPKALAGRIQGINVVDDAAVATKATLELWLFEAAPAAQADNVAFAPTDAEMLTCFAVISLGATPFVGNAGVGAAGNCIYNPVLNQPIPYRTDQTVAKVGNIYAVLVVRSAYIPVASEVFTVELYIQADA